MRSISSPEGLTQRFRRSLSPVHHRALRMVGRLALAAGARAYLVGGIVRDVALGYPDTDLDVVIEGGAERVARAFAGSIGGSFKNLTEFGTCKVETDNFGTIDFATARSETYVHPGALPRTQESDLAHDLVRRDFTINAMALSLGPGTYGRLLDPCGGLPDLKLGRLKVMHAASFRDDPTRILRGIRFAARYDFKFERRTGALARECLQGGGLGTISGKRIYRELKLVSMETSALGGFEMLDANGVLRIVFGRARSSRRPLWRRLPAAIEGIERASGEALPDRWLVWFASLFVGGSGSQAGPVLSNLNPPRSVRETCTWVANDLKRAARRLATLDAEDAYRATCLLRSTPPEGLVHLYAASSPRARQVIVKYLKTWLHVKPDLSGGEIASMGLAKGPEISKMLAVITRLKLEGELASREDEIAYLRRRASSLARAQRPNRGNRC